MTTISVIIPVYGVTRWLDDAIASIGEPDDVPVEVLVIDDGCSPPLTPPAEAGSQNDVVVLRQEHAGAAAARNRGIRHAQGSVLMFLDADDLWVPGKLHEQVRLVAEAPEAVHCGWVQEFASLAPDTGHAPLPQERLLTGASLITTAVSRDVAMEVGPFDEGLRAGEGIDWFLRAESHGLPLQFLPQVLARRRIHAGNRDRQARDESRDYLAVIRRHRLAQGTRPTNDPLLPPVP